MTEAAFPAGARLKTRNNLQFHLYHRNDYELRDALARLHRVWLISAVPTRNHELPLVVRINEAHKIAEHDPVTMAKPRTRQHHGGKAGILQVDRKPRRNQFRATRSKLKRLFEAGAQIKPR